MRSDLMPGLGGAVVDTIHGRAVADPFRELEEPGSKLTRDWLDERGREFAAAARAWPAREWLTAEIRRLAEHEDYSAPRRRGAAVYTAYRPPGAEHPRLLEITAAEGSGNRRRTVFDPAAADPSGRTTLDAWEVSPDGRLVAVQTSADGIEKGRLQVLSTATGQPVCDPVEGVRYTHVAWLPKHDGCLGAFYYVRRDDDPGGGRRGVWLRRIASDADGPPDVLVRSCAGPRTVPGVRVEGGRWLLVSEGRGTGHREDLWIADLAAALPEAPVFAEVHAGLEAGLEAESEARIGPDGMLYLRTSAGAARRRVCRADPARPGEWTEVAAAGDGATIDAFAVVGAPGGQAELLVCRTRLGVSELAAHDPATGRLLRRVPLPGQGMVTRIEAERDEAGGTAAYISYADIARQQRVLTYRPGTRDLVGADAVWPPEVAEPALAPAVHRRVLSCRSADGTAVPLSVFSLHPFDRPRPAILHAYGAYGRPRQFGFSATVLAWLRMGGTYAVAHVRGGGDLGREWHRAGAGRAKRNSVDDLIAAAGELTRAGLCTREQLCLSGGSAGGLLVLAAAVRRPEVCSAVIALAPLADMVRFERMGLGAMWTAEFGTAADPGDFAALLGYSPYHQALARGGGRDYPAVLLNGFHGDTRTGAAHPRKMCAALKSTAARPEQVLLRYEYGVGHGPRAVSRAVDLAADAHAFAAAQTGLLPPTGGNGPEQQEAR